MATKNDLIEAQSFSRRRLLTAFVSGAPGGKELEPAAPLRAVFTAIALTAAVLLVGLFWGLIQPGLPKGWEDGRLILVKDTGARYVTIDSVLHPVINTASARLLIPSNEFRVISTDQRALEGVELGSTLGIVGAPDALPAPDDLVNAGWTACVTDEAGTDVRVEPDAAADAAAGAAVVSSPTGLFVLADDRRYAVDAQQNDAVLRAAGVASLDPRDVSTPWLNLFAPGADLAPFTVADAGTPVAGTDFAVGDVVHIGGAPETERYLIDADGALAPLSPLARELYQLGSGAGSEAVAEVSATDVSGLPTTDDPAGGIDWPADGFTTIAPGERPCALLVDDAEGARTVLATQPQTDSARPGVRVDAGHGALVRAGGRGDQASSLLTLIDSTGTAFALPGATDETIERLGYSPSGVGAVGQDWIALFAAGPALSEDAAGRAPNAAATGSE